MEDEALSTTRFSGSAAARWGGFSFVVENRRIQVRCFLSSGYILEIPTDAGTLHVPEKKIE